MKFAKTAGTLLILSLMSAPLIAKDKNKDHGQGHKKQESNAPAKPDEAKKSAKQDSKVISVQERKVIQSYVNSFNEGGEKHHGRLPPGLEKKVARGGKIPPGWEKKIVPGEIMYSEVLKECKPLPKDLVVKLPTPPVGTLTVTIDGKIVRLMEATKQILDVFEIPLPVLSKR